jgi:hypothetical protein
MLECGRVRRKPHLSRWLVASTAFVVLTGCASSAGQSTSQHEAASTQATPTTQAPKTTAAVCDTWTPDWRDRCAEVREPSATQATPSTTPPPSPGAAPSNPSTPQAQTPSDPAGLTGTVAAGWTLSSDLKPWPSNCDEITSSYQVQVRDNAGDILSIARLVNPRMEDRQVKHGILGFTCEWDYKVGTLPQSPAYTFAVLSDGGSEVDDSKTVSGDSVASGKGPDLYASFCPSCGPGYR